MARRAYALAVENAHSLFLVALLEPLDARETARLRHVPDDEPEAPREGDPTDHRRQYEALLAELEAEAAAVTSP